MDLEERTIEELPGRCESCGGTLTEAEKQAALSEGAEAGAVLCTVCASEQASPDEDLDEGAG